jgi:hypothetical protein
VKAPDIRAIREGLGFNLRELAELLGVSYAAAWRWNDEGLGAREVRGASLKLLTFLAQQDLQALGPVLRKALLTGGTLKAWAVALAPLNSEG